MTRHEIIIKDTHRGLYYEDGVLTQVLGGRPARDPSVHQPRLLPAARGCRSCWSTSASET